MTVKSKLALVLVATVLSAPALAQQPGPSGATAIISEPGKATAARTVEVSAQVVGIDKAKRTLTLKGPKGEVVDVVASDEVKRFDEIKVGDSILARYIEALTRAEGHASQPVTSRCARSWRGRSRASSRRGSVRVRSAPSPMSSPWIRRRARSRSRGRAAT
jgi:hypothetical protein